MVTLFVLLSLGLLALSGAAFVPVQNFWIDTASHFVLQYLVGALILLVLIRMAEEQSFTAYLPALFAVILNTIQLVSFAAPVTAKGENLKILQANVLYTNEDASKLKTLIEAEKPDVILIAEANSIFAAMFDTLKNQYPYQDVIVRENNGFGMAVLSARAWKKADHLLYGGTSVPTIRATFDIGGKAVEIYSIHPQNPLKDFAGRNLVFANMAADLSKTRGVTRIIAGDFNATPYCATYKKFVRDTQMRNAQQGRAVWFGTYPQNLPTRLLRLPIDHMLVSADIAVVDQKTGSDTGSDHISLITTLSIH